MSRISQSGLVAQKTPAPVATGSRAHFDTFETKFFEQGDAGDGERFEYLDDVHDSSKGPPSRYFLLGMAVGGVSVAVLGGVMLWLTGANFGTQAPPAALVAEAETASPPPSPTPPPPSPAAAAEPVPAAVNAEPVPAAVAGEPNLAPTGVAAEQTAPAASPPPAALPVAPAAGPAQPAPAPPVEKPALVAAAGLRLSPDPASEQADAALVSCTKARAGKRSKAILAACPAAFAAQPSADIAVALAKIEFDRGRSSHALEWGKKAVAIDGNAADAYVFIGGGEQMAGHDKAAKEAYRRYLELAPTGRYSRDVRAIVGSAK
jgi:cytoskeletal protein RodZ